MSKTFLREATGLVRSVPLKDAWVFNVLLNNIAFATVLVFTWGPFAFPGGDLVTAIIIATVGVMIVGTVYAIMASSMPRSASDYVFVSRVLHPALGFASSLEFNIWLITYIGITGAWVVALGLPFWFGSLGAVMRSAYLISLANTLALPVDSFIIAAILIPIPSILMILRTRYYFYFNRVMFALGFIGVAVTIAVLLGGTQSTFVANFNDFMTSNGFMTNQSPYQFVLSEAAKEGLAPTRSAYATLGVSAVAFSIIAYPMFSTWFSGEMKNAGNFKNQCIVILGAQLFVGIVMAVLAYIILQVIGSDFAQAFGYLAFSNPGVLGLGSIPPYYMLYANVLTPGNVWAAFLIGLGFTAFIYFWSPDNTICVTRAFFAYSFDGIFPARFASVSDRFGTPVFGIILVTILGEIYLFVQLFVLPYLALYWILYSITVAYILTFIVSSLAVCLFPYRQKSIYDMAPLPKRKILGLPTVTWIGIGSIIFLMVMLYYYMTASALGANSPVSLAAIAVVWLVGFPLFYIAKAYRKRKGIDISMAFKQIPPE